MADPYKNHLEEKYSEGDEIVIARAGAPELRGKIKEIGDEGCVITIPCTKPESVENIFIAYRDVRGIGKTDWDMENIS